jgi:hypothetical protein
METTTYESSNGLAMMFGGFFLLFCMVLAVFLLFCMWKVYTKAGQPGWAAIIPIYNVYILLKIVGKPGWWLLLYFVPFVNIIIGIWVTNLLSKSFGKSEGFTVGLLLLSIIFYPILAFDRTITYKGPAGDPTRFNRINEDVNNIGSNM